MTTTTSSSSSSRYASCCSVKINNNNNDESAANVLSCWAVVVNNSHDVWVWDIQGVPRRFGLATTTTTRTATQRTTTTTNNNNNSRLCFASHKTQNVDDLLTPCFDQDGRHGMPEEECFCGEEEAHLHAHWHDLQNCDGGGSSQDNKRSSSDATIERLANLLLLPLDDDDDNHNDTQDDEKGTPLLSSTVRQEWPCANTSHHMLRQAADTLIWRGDPCGADCTTTNTNSSSSSKNSSSASNTTNTTSPISFRFVGKRAWEDAATGQNLTLHFFNAAAASQMDKEKLSCGGETTGDSSNKASTCSSNQNEAINNDCCSGEEQGSNSCCDDSQQKDSPACCSSPQESKSTTACCNSETVQEKTDSGVETIPQCTKNGKPAGCCDSNKCSAEESEQSDGAAGRTPTKDDCAAACEAKCETDSKCCADEEKCCAGDNAESFIIEPNEIDAETKSIGRSQFYVGGLCCASEIPVIHGILDGIPGIQRVAVNPTTKMVYVNHSEISATEVASMLNGRGMGAEVLVDGLESLTKHRQSLFVVSKFKLGSSSQNVQVDDNRIDLLLRAYDETEVESFAFHVRDKILTVVHNPWTIETKQILQALQSVADSHKIEIMVDGSDQKGTPLDYATLAASVSTSKEEPGNQSNRIKWPRPTVVLSGVFWVISMLSYVGDKWEYLKYSALASVAFGLPPIARKAFGTLRHQFRFDANGLMLVASLGALALGEFPEAAAVVFLFALSEWLEHRASSRARLALSAIVHLRPDKARIIDPETQQLWTVPAVAVPVGALVSVMASDKIACDGIVVEGQSTVDESSLTGESRPIRKGPKDSVSGGTINTGMRQLVIRTTSTADDSAVARLIRLVEEAQLNHSETEKRVDEFAKFYTPMVLLCAVLMCTIPWLYGSSTGRKWTKNALVCIVVACPCALIISTPVTYVAGLAATAQKGILIKGGAFLEALGQVSHICFDKTGTLTTGNFSLLHLDVVGDYLTRRQVLEYLLLIEERAVHPLAQAITAAARNENVSIPKNMVLQKHTVLAGEGVTGVMNGQDVFVGNERLFTRLGLLAGLPGEISDRVESWKCLGGTIGFVAVGDRITGIYCAADAVRPEAAEVVSALQGRGIGLSMLTGDNEEAAQSVGQQLGWHKEKNEIHSQLLPEDKLTIVQELTDVSANRSKWCYRRSIVIFVGDGLNDAPSLAAAHVGVAMGSGATVAMETAHVTLLDPSLRKLEFAQNMGRQVLVKIVENIIFSLSVKAAVLVWAFAGTPSLWLAIASDVGSMLLVTLNSMRLLPAQGKPSDVRLQQHLEVEKMP